jgi:hypothetical protein
VPVLEQPVGYVAQELVPAKCSTVNKHSLYTMPGLFITFIPETNSPSFSVMPVNVSRLFPVVDLNIKHDQTDTGTGTGTDIVGLISIAFSLCSVCLLLYIKCS